MPCFDCHTSDEMHGKLGEAEHRYDGPPTPSCTDADCHPDVGPATAMSTTASSTMMR